MTWLSSAARRVFVDTSAWFAYVNRKDPDHSGVVQAMERFEGRLVTSSYVFDETVTLCLYRLDNTLARTIGMALRDPRVVELSTISADDESNAWQLFLDRSDKIYSFTDCTSFTMMRRLGLHRVLATDEDFRREGFEVLP